MGKEAGAWLPLSATHEVLLAALAAGGLADADNSAVIRAFEK